MTVEHAVPLWQLYTFSALGTLMLWTKLSVQNKRIHGFGDILEHAFPNSKRAQYIAQFLIFVVLGAFLGVFLVGPFTQLHAFTGGVAWSRLAAKD